jgi:AAA family ATP:ADP antiporter
MYHKIVRILWGDLSKEDLKKFSLLATGFFFLIGAWWPLKTLKDSIFINIVGSTYIPKAKIASLILFFPLVLMYSKLVDIVSKEKLIYLFITFYGAIGLALVYFLYHPTIGLANPTVDPSRWLGWILYLYAESFISLMLSLYWSFINDVTTPESAKKGYGLIIFGTQFGGLLFTIWGNILSYDTTRYAQTAPFIILVCVLTFFLVGLIVFILERSVDKKQLAGYQDRSGQDKVTQPEAIIGFFDGLKLLFTQPYVAGIFGLICFQEIISTMMGFQMNLLVSQTYSDPGMVNRFLFNFAFCVQIIACLFGLVGTSFFQRIFGIRFCLISYPILLGLSILGYLFYPTLGSIFCVMLIAKALNYALNQPAKEVLYIPTSRNIKYKSKAWIDMFGLRFAKAAGATANDWVGTFVSLTGGLALGLIAVWSVMAGIIGTKFKKTVDQNKMIE